jgi:hypothetical protein
MLNKTRIEQKKFRAELGFGFFFCYSWVFLIVGKSSIVVKKKGVGVLFFCYNWVFFDDELKVEIEAELKLELELEIRAELKLELELKIEAKLKLEL